MGKYKTFYWVVGFCAFLALMCSGVAWILGLCHIPAELLKNIRWIAKIVLSVCAFLAGWVWLITSVKPGTFRIVLQVLFVIFAILAFFDVFQVGLGII